MISRTAGEDGAALLIALLTTMIVAAFGVAVILTSDVETRVVADFSRTLDAREAAAAAIDAAVTALEPAIDWTAALTGGLTAPLDASLRVTTPAGVAIDLDASRRDLQAEMDAIAAGAMNRPVWRLFASGTLASVMGFAPADTRAYVAVWIADDWREADGDPQVDTNGIVILRAEAWGLAGAFRAVDVTMAHGDLQTACDQPVAWTYDPGRSPGMGWHGSRTLFSGFKGRIGASLDSAGFQVANPCRTIGPGATIVTWREVR
jgi:hypothetical protein